MKRQSLLPVDFLVALLMTFLCPLLDHPATAQTFTVLHTFTAVDTNNVNNDGASPYAGLILSGNALYGTASGGGSGGSGTIFSLNTDGTGFTTLHSFTALSLSATNTDGAFPTASLILSSNTLYGTTVGGGMFGNGTLFALSTNGTGFSILHSFDADFDMGMNFDGAGPNELLVSGNTLYGTARSGGLGRADGGYGTVFAMSTDGSVFTRLHNFRSSPFPPSDITHVDGAFPQAGVILSGDTLFGTSKGYFPGYGNVFAMSTNGTVFRSLYIFESADPFFGATNSDGSNPIGGLVLWGKTLYGTTCAGGPLDGGTVVPSGGGTVFAVNTDGTGFRTLHSFSGITGPLDSDGAGPQAGLVLFGNTLYGTTWGGSSDHSGTVFALNTDGTGFTTLRSFTATSNNSSWVYTNSDGAYPKCRLILSGSTLYGTTSAGGTFGNGTVFAISLMPQLTLAASGSNLVLSWPTNFEGFTVQTTTTLASPIWTTNVPAPTVVNGQYTVTTPISGTQEFFRLSQ